jgi:hypothetical protein
MLMTARLYPKVELITAALQDRILHPTWSPNVGPGADSDIQLHIWSSITALGASS